MKRINLDQEKIIALLQEGLFNHEIAERLGVGKEKIRTYVAQHKLAHHRTGLARQPPRPVGDGLFECNKCHRHITIEDFPYVRNRCDGRRLSYCRKCRYKEYLDGLRADPQKYWHTRTNALRKRSREKNILFDLPKDYLYDKWNSQEGLCFYTDVQMSIEINNGLVTNAASVDKVVPDTGYTINNIVLCSKRINLMKLDITPSEMAEWMPGWYQRLTQAGILA